MISLLVALSLVLLQINGVLGGGKPPPSIYGEFAPEKPLELEPDQQAIVGTLIALLFLLMAFEISTPEVLFLTALTIVTFCEIITLPEALSGFSNAAVITIGSLFIVIGAVEKSHVIDWFARKAFGSTGSTLFGKLRLYVMCFSLSTFFNNTPLVALLMPVVKDWGRMRGISASQLLMPLSFAVLAGSFGSMIGTSTNLTVQGLMLAERGYEFPFFAPLPIGIVCFLVLLVYMLIAGPYILPTDQNGLIREARDKTESLIAEIFVSSSSQSVGKSVAYMMNSIGLAPSYAIKIRRKLRKAAGEGAPTSSETDESKNRSASIDILDNKYIKRFQAFWQSSVSGDASPSKPANDADKSYASLQGNATSDLESDQQEFVDIVAPSGHDLIQAEDIVFVSSAQEVVAKMMKSIAGESKGLHILESDVLALPGFGSELVECVISDTNPFIGQKPSAFASTFAEKYKIGIITVRSKDWGRVASSATNVSSSANEAAGNQSGVELTDVNVKSNEKPSNSEAAKAEVGEHTLSCGDTILGVTNSKEVEALSKDRDFFVVSTVGSLPVPITYFSFIPILLFILMLIMVAME